MTAARAKAEDDRYDLVIRDGVTIDGTGAPAVRADIAVIGDRIVAMGEVTGHAAREIDAAGMCVTPGFVDIHTHSDISAPFNPGQASSIAMGVTTQVTGNCGLSLGLATSSERFAFEQRWLEPHGARIIWEDFAGFLQFVSDNGFGTNFISLAGHGTLRKRVMGGSERSPSKDEAAGMRRELHKALEAGAWGLSSGLEYPPSSFADESELSGLLHGPHMGGRIYATHLRDEGDRLVSAVQEALNVADRSNVRLQLSHHKAEGRHNWGTVRKTLAMVDAARASGVDVQLDQYPYTAFMTGLAIQVLPPSVRGHHPEQLAQLLADPKRRSDLEAEIHALHPGWDEGYWSNVRIGVSRSRKELQGRSIAELAVETGRDPLETALDLVADTSGYISAVNFAISEEDIATVMRYPWTSIGSDGVGTDPNGAEDLIHPRAYGTFPRVLGRYVRELGVLTPEAAIHKMTGLPSTRMGLCQRGKLATGYYADITIYDPERVGDRATFESPHQFAVGIEAVVVNGRVVYENGAPNGVIAGRVLRPDGAPRSAKLTPEGSMSGGRTDD